VRYRILGVLFVLSFVNYLLRNNLSIAIPSIQEEFSFSNAELGWILGSFNFSYALLQIPGGIFGQIYGPRRALTFMALSWGVLTFLTGFVPALMAASATGAMVSLLVIRVFLGATNAPLFPITAGAFANWFPAGRWAFPNAALSVGLVLGQAAIGPIVTALIVKYGWRESFYLFAPLGLLIGAWWYWYGRDRPAQHPAITDEEVRLIEGDQPSREPDTRERRRMAPHARASRRAAARCQLLLHELRLLHVRAVAVHLSRQRRAAFRSRKRLAVRAAVRDRSGARGPRRAHVRCAVQTDRRNVGLPVTRDDRAGSSWPSC
jgi:MFS family permease